MRNQAVGPRNATGWVDLAQPNLKGGQQPVLWITVPMPVLSDQPGPPGPRRPRHESLGARPPLQFGKAISPGPFYGGRLISISVEATVEMAASPNGPWCSGGRSAGPPSRRLERSSSPLAIQSRPLPWMGSSDLPAIVWFYPRWPTSSPFTQTQPSFGGPGRLVTEALRGLLTTSSTLGLAGLDRRDLERLFTASMI
jgi:hypothetical protein